MADSKYDDMVIFNGPEGPFSNDRNFDQAEYLHHINPPVEEEPEEEEVEEEETEEETEDDSSEDSEDDSSAETKSETEEGAPDYTEMSPKALKALAVGRNITTKGMTKKSQLIAALEAADEGN